MDAEALRAEGFSEFGAFRPDSGGRIVFVPIRNAPRPFNVIYAYLDKDTVRYVGETSRAALFRAEEVVAQIRQHIKLGLAPVGATRRLLAVVDKGQVIRAFTGPSLGGITDAERKAIERQWIQRCDTLFEFNRFGWNGFGPENEF